MVSLILGFQVWAFFGDLAYYIGKTGRRNKAEFLVEPKAEFTLQPKAELHFEA
jgi:hypothetical protein